MSQFQDQYSESQQDAEEQQQQQQQQQQQEVEVKVDTEGMALAISQSIQDGFNQSMDDSLPLIERTLTSSIVNSTAIAFDDLEHTSGRIIRGLETLINNSSTSTIAALEKSSGRIVDTFSASIEASAAKVLDLFSAEMDLIVAATATQLQKVASNAIREGTEALPGAASAATESAVAVVLDSGLNSAVLLGGVLLTVNVLSLVLAFLFFQLFRYLVAKPFGWGARSVGNRLFRSGGEYRKGHDDIPAATPLIGGSSVPAQGAPGPASGFAIADDQTFHPLGHAGPIKRGPVGAWSTRY